MPLAPGTRFGPYEIELALGSGGMGDVYRARDTRLHRAVAIKMLREPAGADAARRIMVEARAAARLNHPNIATLHDVVEQEAGSFLVMEYVDGASLKAAIAAGPFTVDRALGVVIQLADALAYAHREGVVHRDVKPANVALTRDGQVKLLDLGIAQAAASDPGEATRTGTDEHVAPRRQGTPAYMAPEQIAGQPSGARGDIYSTGVLLYELLTGRRPFDAPDLIGFAAAIAAGPPPRVSDARRDTPAELDAIILRAMARDPAARYDTAGALRDDLMRVRENLRPGAVGLPVRARHTGRRTALIATAAALVVLVGWAVTNGWFTARAPGPIAILPALNASEDPELEVIGATLVTMIGGNVAVTPGAATVSSNPARYRQQSRDARKAVAEVGARYLLDLRVQRTDGRVGLDAQLIEAARESPVWRHRFEGTPFDVVRDLTRGVADALERKGVFAARLVGADRQKLRRLPVNNAAAFDAYLRGRTLLDSSRDRARAEQAVKAFEAATDLDASSALAFAGLSHGRTQLFNYTQDRRWAEQAATAAKRALELDPTLAPVQEAAARMEQAAGQLEKAQAHARDAVRLAPDADSGHRLLASILWARFDKKGAIEAATIAVRLRPEWAPGQYVLGYYYLTSGQYRDAIAPLVRATELQPESPANFTALGTAYHQAGDVRQAIGHYAQALRLGPNAQAYSNLGTAYYWAGQFANAVENYRQAIVLDATSATTHRNLADAFLRLGRTSDARVEYEAAIVRADTRLKGDPRNVQQIAVRAFCEAKLGRLDAAQRDIAAALTVSRRQNADVMFKSAVIQTLAGRPDQALSDLDEALKLGYPVAFARDDWELRSLRQMPKFTVLINRQPQ